MELDLAAPPGDLVVLLQELEEQHFVLGQPSLPGKWQMISLGGDDQGARPLCQRLY